MVTLREIAERLGCTRSTVSYALRNHPHVAAATRAAVQQVARELGWRPNAELARHMALVRSTRAPAELPNLAIVINKPVRAMKEEEATPRLHLEGAQARASELGYHADVFNLAEAPLPAGRLRQILRARGVRGVVFIATLGTMLPLEHLRLGSGFASAVVGVRYPELAFNVAINDFKMTGHTAVLAVRERGFRRPGAVLPRRLDAMLAWAFAGAIHAGQLELPAADRVETLHVGEEEIFLPDSTFAAIRQWLVQEQPDVLLTTDPRNLARCLAAAGAPATRIPIVSLDLHPGQPVIGGVDQRQSVVGAAGVDLMVAQLHRGEVGVSPIQHTLQIEGVWQDAPGHAPVRRVVRRSRSGARRPRSPAR